MLTFIASNLRSWFHCRSIWKLTQDHSFGLSAVTRVPSGRILLLRRPESDGHAVMWERRHRSTVLLPSWRLSHGNLAAS